ncbi:MAG: hypothetical protein HQK76_02180 [Desulfobacterales bacterium]|nr:hypothetical protein [Desulfobacterales bacterium]
MGKSKLYFIPIALVNIGIMGIFITVYFSKDIQTNIKYILYGSGVITLLSTFFFKRRLNAEELGLKAERMKLEASKQALIEQEKEFETIKKEIEDDLKKRSLQIQKKQTELTQQLSTYHEWMEFPKDSEIIDEHIEENPELIAKDQKVQELIEKRTELLFDKIKTNKYIEDDKFQRGMLWKDILAIIIDIAKIYQPESKNPLLETSVEKLLRAINRISLQLLVVLEELPLNLKDYNLINLYENLSMGIKAYGAYKAAEPYLPIIKPIYYLGRFTLGTNPITLGATWALSELIKSGTKKIASNLANRYALNLLYELVFIIGNESAGIFGGAYKHREPQLIYGAELVELLSRFKISEDRLLKGLNEVGILHLRNEYDRIFLYRCLAAHKSPKPDRFKPRSFLPTKQRQTIASRIENFAKNLIEEDTNSLFKWKQETEERLGVKIHLSDVRNDTPSDVIASECIKSLSSFLVGIKNKKAHELLELLSESVFMSLLNETSKTTLIESIIDEPPMIFDFPEIESSDELIDDYIKELMHITVRMFPYNIEGYLSVQEVINYFKPKEIKAFQKKFDQMYVDFFNELISPFSPEKKLKTDIVRLILAILNNEESSIFIYKNVVIEMNDETNNITSPSNKDLLLIGTNRRVFLLSLKNEDTEDIIIWSCQKENGGLYTECIEGKWSIFCLIKGGNWHWKKIKALEKLPSIKVGAPLFGKFNEYFKLILNF